VHIDTYHAIYSADRHGTDDSRNNLPSPLVSFSGKVDNIGLVKLFGSSQSKFMHGYISLVVGHIYSFTFYEKLNLKCLQDDCHRHTHQTCKLLQHELSHDSVLQKAQ
jgi:hypothetical protein